MGYGGPTWDDAGVLTNGATNTFDTADVTETGAAQPYMHAWWTFTPGSDRTALIDTGATTGVFGIPDTMIHVYTGATEGTKALVASNDDTDTSRLAAVVVSLTGGVTYHILVGTFYPDGDGVVTYQVNLAPTTLRPKSTDWLGTFRDRDDNVLVVGSDTLRALNPWVAWETDPGWYDSLLRGAEGQRALGRRGAYHIQSVDGGTSLLDGADDCAWAHAVNADISDPVTLWNTSTNTSPLDNGPPTCRPLGENPVFETAVTARYTLDYSAPGFLVAGSMIAEVDIGAFSPALRYARDNLTELGVLPNLANALADGVPADFADSATFEWEPGAELELVGVEITGDANGVSYPDAETTFLIDPANGPVYSGGGTFTSWAKGIPTAAGTSFAYEDGTDWHDLPFTSFDDFADDGPDMVIASAMTRSLDATTPSVFAEVGNPSTIGYRFTFRSPRYRWTWIEPGPTNPLPTNIPPRRIWPRNDGATQGSRRALGGGNTRQSGSRTIGSIL